MKKSPVFLNGSKLLRTLLLGALLYQVAAPCISYADSVNSPNITLNVDTNRSTGNGAGNVAVTINTVTIAETMLPEYSAGGNKIFKLKVKPGYQFDPSSNVTAQSATFGINGLGLNVAASRTPNGTANEEIFFELTSGNGNNNNVQDIIRVNGIKIKILSAEGAAGPAQTTIQLTTSLIGGAFTNQGIVAANITRGAGDRLIFSTQPGSNLAGADLLPEVKVVDFGGNVINTDTRTISLALQTNPGSATLNGTVQRAASAGVAKWVVADDLNITSAATGYTLRASHNGASLLTSNTVDSSAFEISAANPGQLLITSQPTDTSAGGDILLTVNTADQFGNLTTTSGVEVSIDSAVNPGGWPLLVDTSLTKSTVNGVASWAASDHLRITKAVNGYKLSVAGLGTPLTTNEFNIIPGVSSLIRFVQQPTDTEVNKAFTTPVSAEITDFFGNRTSSTASVTLNVDPEECSTGLSGNTANASSGLVSFPSFLSGTACGEASLFAVSDGLIGASSDSFDITAADAYPISLNSAEFQKNKKFQFNSKGTFIVSTAETDDPTKNGATLTVTGTSGTVTYTLPKKNWKKSGKSGFQFSNKKCESVKVTSKSISALCQGRTGTLALPETELDVELKVGSGTQKYCGNCGGTSVGNQNKKFKRKSCTAPEACF